MNATPDPAPAAGFELATMRRTYGVSQAAIAEELGVHRITIIHWEAEPIVDVIRAERYREAVRVVTARVLGREPV